MKTKWWATIYFGLLCTPMAGAGLSMLDATVLPRAALSYAVLIFMFEFPLLTRILGKRVFVSREERE